MAPEPPADSRTPRDELADTTAHGALYLQRLRQRQLTLSILALVAFGALLMRATQLAFGPPRGPVGPVRASYVPIFAHLTLVLVAGVWLPGPLVAWFRHVAALLG